MDTDSMIHKSDFSKLSDMERDMARLDEEEAALQSQLDKIRAEQQRLKLQKLELLNQMCVKAKADFETSSTDSPYTTNAFTTPATSRHSTHPMDTPTYSPDDIIVAAAKPTTDRLINHGGHSREQREYDNDGPVETAVMYHDSPVDSVEQPFTSSPPPDSVGASVTLKTTTPALSRSDSALGKRKRATSRRAPIPDVPSSPGYRPHRSSPVVTDERRRSHRQSGIPPLRDPSAPPNADLDLFDDRLYPHKITQYGRFKTILIDENGDGLDLHCPACHGNRRPDGELLSGLRGIHRHVAQSHANRFTIKGVGEKDLLALFLRGKIEKADLSRLEVADDDEQGEHKSRQVGDARDVIVFEERDVGKDDEWGIWVDGKKVPREAAKRQEEDAGQNHADAETGAETSQAGSPEL